jgi:hypothetical protein
MAHTISSPTPFDPPTLNTVHGIASSYGRLLASIVIGSLPLLRAQRTLFALIAAPSMAC